MTRQLGSGLTRSVIGMVGPPFGSVTRDWMADRVAARRYMMAWGATGGTSRKSDTTFMVATKLVHPIPNGRIRRAARHTQTESQCQRPLVCQKCRGKVDASDRAVLREDRRPVLAHDRGLHVAGVGRRGPPRAGPARAAFDDV